jgi:hypothetical protein
MDLWVGDSRSSRGLGVEFKFLMSKHEAATVPHQAQRLRRHERVDSAAFILWGHGPSEGLGELFSEPEEGWTPWMRVAQEVFPAYFRGPEALTVCMFGSDREGAG